MSQNDSIKNFSYLGFGRIAAIGLQALFYFILAALLEPESYGELSVIVALAGTFSVISTLGLNVSLQVYVAKKNSTLSNQINTLFVISTTIAGLILLPINPLGALLCVSMSLFSMNQFNLMGLKQYKNFMLNALLKSSTYVIIPLLLYFVLEIPGIVLGMAISNLIASIPFFKILRLKKFFELKNYYRVLIHNFGVSISGTLPFVVDKLLIAPLFGLFIVGVYQFNLQIFFALGILPGVLGSYLVSEESSGITHKKISYLVILGSIIVAAIAILTAPYFVNGFFPKYSDGILGLQIMVIAIIPQAISSVFGAKLLAKESTKIGYSAIIQVGSLLLLIALLGSPYGLVGLGIAVLISQAANTLFLYSLFRTSSKIKTI